jgi:nickel-dependent lactate racemase
MKDICLRKENIEHKDIEYQLRLWFEGLSTKPKKVLIIPPDITRIHSKSGIIVQMLFRILEPTCHVDIMPALGTHNPMNNEEIEKMFGTEIPKDRFLVHNWRGGVIKIGEVPEDLVSSIFGRLLKISINVEINKTLINASYEQIISIGQVVPNEVAGMGGYSKNILVGCGGTDFINKTHFLGAAYGMEKMMGRGDTPVRKLFNYAQEHFLSKLPITYFLTVTSGIDCGNKLKGLFIGKSHEVFDQAVSLSQKYNIKFLDKELKKVVVYLEPNEFKSTWLGDKAIYRTRMAIADGGELLIIAPGVKEFGEDKTMDSIIRKYGHVGSKKIIQLVEENEDLRTNLSAAAHLIHGSTEGRFKVTYATDHLSKDEFEQINVCHQTLSSAYKKYSPDKLINGYNIMPDGEEVFFVNNPALGLWALRKDFDNKEL